MRPEPYCCSPFDAGRLMTCGRRGGLIDKFDRCSLARAVARRRAGSRVAARCARAATPGRAHGVEAPQVSLARVGDVAVGGDGAKEVAVDLLGALRSLEQLALLV